MKYKYISFILIPMTILTVTAQNMSIFSRATQSGWYPEFLYPVVDSINKTEGKAKILDIGTGLGTLPQLLIESDSNLQITGIDIDSAMIEEAKRRCKHKNISYQIQGINAPLDFQDQQFDVVTFCSVLFLVDENTKNLLMKEALRVLKPNGKILILTPSGKKSLASSFIEVWKYPFSANNFTFPIWKMATTYGGRKWARQKWLAAYARDHQLSYQSALTFNQNAIIETSLKTNNQ